VGSSVPGYSAVLHAGQLKNMGIGTGSVADFRRSASSRAQSRTRKCPSSLYGKISMPGRSTDAAHSRTARFSSSVGSVTVKLLLSIHQPLSETRDLALVVLGEGYPRLLRNGADSLLGFGERDALGVPGRRAVQRAALRIETAIAVRRSRARAVAAAWAPERREAGASRRGCAIRHPRPPSSEPSSGNQRTVTSSSPGASASSARSSATVLTSASTLASRSGGRRKSPGHRARPTQSTPESRWCPA